MSNQQYYIAEQDNDVSLPVFTKDGRPLALPAFICGVRIAEIESKKTGESLKKIDFEFEIHESASKAKDIDLFVKDENDKYDYSKPTGKTVKATAFVGKKVRGGEIWQNLTKSSGKMNRILIQELPSFGVEISEEVVIIEGQEYTAKVIPELDEESFLGNPVFIFLKEESFTSKRGQVVNLTKVGKVVSAFGKFDKEIVMKNTMKMEQLAATASAKPSEDNPFAGIGSDEDELPF
ncbi:hypothetical protein GW932_02795 [archaeon]|nr:hypothetical protein [archaeon]